MIFAAAQMKPSDNNITKNVETHGMLIKKAAEHGVQFIVFPEMSLTGYLRESAKDHAFILNDSRLNPLRQLAAKHAIIIAAGAPVKLGAGLHIGTFILLPDGRERLYTKQYLHQDEDESFEPSLEHNPTVTIGDETVCFAICADITNPAHPLKANKAGCTVYTPGIFYTPGAINEAHTMLSGYARQYGMNVLMANFCGESWGWKAAGRSAFWSADGTLIAQADAESSCLVVAEKKAESWAGRVISA